jgi:protein-disulfide isomerase
VTLMSDLRSAPIPELDEADHVRGAPGAPLLIEYGDLECPYCATLHLRLRALVASGARRLAFRHFPVRSAHPRAWAAACASEAAGLQGRFWEMHDAILEDQGRIEDPHLWARAETLGLDLERFESDRRGEAVRTRVQDDFMAGVRGGVVTTPTVFFEGIAHTGEALAELLASIGGA